MLDENQIAYLRSIANGITLSGYNVFFRKNAWTADEHETAKSIGLSFFEGLYYCDIRIQSKLSLYDFMLLSFPKFCSEENFKQQRDRLFSKIKTAYDTELGNFEKFCKENFVQTQRFYQHQIDGLYWGCNRKHNLLSFEQGLGKTITSAMISEVMQAYPTLVVAPGANKFNWLEDLVVEWGFNEANITIIDSKKTKTAFRKEKFIIVNYELFKKNVEFFKNKGIRHVILDECHKVKNVDSQTSKSVKQFVREVDCKLTLLSGTAAPNRTEDMFAYLNMTGHVLGENRNRFLKRFTTQEDTGWGSRVTGSKNTEILSRCISNFFIRKTKEKCLDLPDKTYIKLWYELEDYKEQYELELLEFKKTLKSRKKEDSQVALQRLNIITSKAKIKNIIELVEGICEQTVMVDGVEKPRKCVIFTSFKEPIEMLYAHFKESSSVIVGKTPISDRMTILNEFKSNPDKKVLLGNIRAAGIGTNITNDNISDVIFVNFPFTQAELDQAIDRLHRIGRKTTINIYYTMCKGSIDEKLLGMVDKKYKDVSMLVDRKLPEFDFDETTIKELLLNINNNQEENEQEQRAEEVGGEVAKVS